MLNRKGYSTAKTPFQGKDGGKCSPYLQLIKFGFNDKDTDNLISHFRDKSRRKEFFNYTKSGNAI